MNISDGFGVSRRRVRNHWRWLTIIYQVTVLAGKDLWDCGVCWKHSGIVLASIDGDVINLTEIGEASTSVGDIWSRLQSGGNDYGAGAGAVAAGEKD